MTAHRGGLSTKWLRRSRKNRLNRNEHDGLPTLVLGAGDAARELVRALQAVPAYGLKPIAFLDDNLRLGRISGLPVLGELADLPVVARSTGAKAALVAIPSLRPGRIAELIEMAAECGLLVRHLPSFLAAVERDIRISDLRGVRVDELLGRAEVHVSSDEARALIQGKRVLVTGAGGSIGSELCRQIKRFGPSALYLLDHDESNLHGLHLDLAGSGLLDNDGIIIADIRDRPRLAQIFETTKPEIVFHAAAHKHLPLLERHPCEGVKTNVLGTQHLVELCVEHGAERFVLISTDKAADPTSVLGATKRLAELVVQDAAGRGTAMASVRFGNVLGSRGSLLTVLADQMARERAVTVTHPDVTRFFMTVEEAVGLVLEAVTMAGSAETFVLDMGEPVPILDLVHKYAAALNVDNVEIQFTGLRPGEKLNEVVFSDSEERLPTAHPKVWSTRPKELNPDLHTMLEHLYVKSAVNDDEAVLKLLRNMVPEYDPGQPTGPAAAATSDRAPYPDGF
jgi:FlaA1/EpsC-like NDP-sugar epimerase